MRIRPGKPVFFVKRFFVIAGLREQTSFVILVSPKYLVLSTELTRLFRHRKEIGEVTFRGLALRRRAKRLFMVAK